MTIANTYVITYTISDISRVFDCFAADFDMIAQSTGLRSRQNVKETCEDINTMAKSGYLQDVNVYLQDVSGKIIRASKYEVSTEAALWTSQRPGNNLWPRTPGGQLNVIVTFTQAWGQLSGLQRQLFLAGLRHGWGMSNVDTSFPMLIRYSDRDYASNGYGLRKSVFK